DLRVEHEIDAGLFTQFQIDVARPRIALEVLMRPELRRVHEDTDRRRVAVAARPLHQAEMPGVQRSHRRHETHGTALTAQLQHRGADVRDPLVDAHYRGKA